MPRRRPAPFTVSLTYRLPADPSREWERVFPTEAEARAWAAQSGVVPLRLDRLQRLRGRKGPTIARMSQPF